MSNQKGSSTVEYIIPAALVALVIGLGVYSIGSSGNLLNFFAASSGMEIDKGSQKLIVGDDSMTAKPLVSDFSKQTVLKDVTGIDDGVVYRECKNGLCTIDLGGLILDGIPEDFNEFVKTSGNSGGTDVLASLMSQIAIQLEEEGKLAESEEVKKLASLGHNMALLEKEFEVKINNCNLDQSCINKVINYDWKNEDFVIINDNSFPKPAGFDETYYKLPEGIGYKDILYSLALGDARRAKSLNNSKYEEYQDNNYISVAFNEQLDNILAENSGLNLDDQVKGLIKELSWDIGIIGEDFQNNIGYLIGIRGDQSYQDPITGESFNVPEPDDVVENVVNYNASKITNLDSSLICAAGNNQDSGTKCH